jgi:hypothetical protein
MINILGLTVIGVAAILPFGEALWTNYLSTKSGQDSMHYPASD